MEVKELNSWEYLEKVIESIRTKNQKNEELTLSEMSAYIEVAKSNFDKKDYINFILWFVDFLLKTNQSHIIFSYSVIIEISEQVIEYWMMSINDLRNLYKDVSQLSNRNDVDTEKILNLMEKAEEVFQWILATLKTENDKLLSVIAQGNK